MGIPDEFWIGFVIMVGFFLKLVYVSKLGYASGTPVSGTWQEAADAVRTGGHLDVISFIYSHHHLPTVDVRGLIGYSDPPFYYIICSLWMELLHRLLNWSANVSLYCLMALNVIYVMVGECCGIGILKKFGVRGRKLVVAILFLIFFPACYHMSAALDGSAMSFMFTMLAVNSALSWFGSRREKTLTTTAVELGLGLLCSYWAVLALPAMIVLMVYAAGDGRRNQTPLRIQFRNFGLIVGIMGLIWPVSLSIRFSLPLFYTEGRGALISGAAASAAGRLKAPDGALLSHLHTVGEPLLESNIWAQTFKTAIVDFTGIDISLKGTYIITMLLLYVSIALCVLMHIMLFYTLFAANRIDRAHRRFLFFGYLAALGIYIAACFVVPYTGTMDFKFVMFLTVFPLAGMSVCGSGDLSDNLFEKITTWLGNAMILLLAFLTAFLFGFYY